MIIPCLAFGTITKLFHNFTTFFHPCQQRVLMSAHPPQHWLFSLFNNYKHPSEWKMVSHCGLNLYFLNDYWCGASCHVLVGIYLLQKNIYSSPLWIFKIELFVSCWVIGVLYIVWILAHYQIHYLQIMFSCSVGSLFTF